MIVVQWLIIQPPKKKNGGSVVDQKFRFDSLLKEEKNIYDFCIVYSRHNGYHIASLIMQKIKDYGYSCCLFREAEQKSQSFDQEGELFDQTESEKRIANSIVTIAILTSDCLNTEEMIFSLKAASFHYKEISRIILVHDAESCFFPVPPTSVSDCFAEKAITWISCYSEDGVNQIIQKFEQEKINFENLPKNITPEDTSTRLFLSHKRSTGQGIAGRLYEGLKNEYKIFLDSESNFNIHDLKKIVQHTEVMLFILSHGILLSHWCLQELLSALENNKRVIVVRDLSYKLPAELPTEWEKVSHILRSPDHLIWIAEYNSACIRTLKKRIGLGDQTIKLAESLIKNPIINKNFAQKTLDLTLTHIPKHITTEIVPAVKSIGKLQFNTIKLPELFKFDPSDFDSNVEHIYVKNISDNELKILSKYSPNIQTISLVDSIKITDSGIKMLSEGCHNIISIFLQGCNLITDSALKFLSEGCHNIQTISLGSCNSITDTGLKFLSEGCHYIKTISLDGCVKITDSGLNFLSEGCTKIQNINLQACNKITKSGLKNLSERCHEIQSINMRSCSNIKNKSLKFLAEGCQNLQVLQVGGCVVNQISDIGIKYLSEKCRNLQTINLSGCDSLTNTGLKFISEGFNNLQSINLGGCDKITDTGIEFLSEGCKNLQIVNLGGCDNISDISMKFLSEGCHNIHTLLIFYCEKITDNGMKFLSEGCPKIQTIQLPSFNNIGDKGLKFLSSGCHEIQTISLSGFCTITDVGLSFLSQGCKELRVLNLDGCRKITDIGLKTISECNNLRSINLQNCKRITDKGLKFLTEGCPNLQAINLESCIRITERGFKLLSDKYANIKISM